MSSRASRLGKNTMLVFFGNIGAKVIGLVMLPFYTHWLTVEDYGLTDVITIYVTFLIGIITCCIGESLFVFPKGASNDEQKKYFTSGFFFLICTSTFTAFIFLLLSIIFDCKAIHNSFADNIWLIYFMLISQVVQQTTQQCTRSLDKMKVYSVTGIVCTLFTALLGFVLVPKQGVNGYVLSIILANIIAGLYSFIFSGIYNFIDINFIKKNHIDKMLRYSIPLIPNGIMWWLVNALNRPLMEFNIGLHDMGIYAVANKIPGILSMVFTIFATSWQISVLEEYGKEGYGNFYNRVFKLTFGVLLIAFIGLTMFSKIIMNIFVDADFYDAWKYAPLLTLGVLFSNVSGFAGSIFSATRESKYYFYSSVWGAVVAIGLNIILIPMIGVLGACISVIVSFAAMSISRIAYGWKYVKINGIAKYLLVLSICIVFMMFYVNDLPLIYTLTMLGLSVISLVMLEKEELILVGEFIKSKMLNIK